jgi:hypothetical protein
VLISICFNARTNKYSSQPPGARKFELIYDPTIDVGDHFVTTLLELYVSMGSNR